MNRFLTLFFLLSLITPFLSAQQTLTRSFIHDGLQREYILYIPANYTGNSPVPLLFNFHGYTSNATQQMWYGDFRDIADTAGFIVIHPEGTRFEGKTHFNVGGWTLGSTVDDVSFTEAMIDTMFANYNIDQNRIYSTGMSNGGYMSFLLACQLSDKIAAVASVTGTMTPEIYNPCNPTHPTPILQIHGTSDNVVPYYGANWSKSVDQVRQYWATYNNCALTEIKTVIPNVNTADGSSVEHFVYENGDSQSRVEHYKVTGGGHTWPGTANTTVGANQDFNASLVIWEFFSQYDLASLQESTTAIDPGEKLEVKLYPNPTQSQIIVERKSAEKMDYEILDLQGKVVATGNIQGREGEIDLRELPASIYFVSIAGVSYKVLKVE